MGNSTLNLQHGSLRLWIFIKFRIMLLANLSWIKKN